MQIDRRLMMNIGKQNIGDDVNSKVRLKINFNELKLFNSSTKKVCLLICLSSVKMKVCLIKEFYYPAPQKPNGCIN